MRRIGMFLVVSIFMLGACGGNDNNEYENEVKRALEIQEETHTNLLKHTTDTFTPKFDKDKVNAYVYEKDKIVILGYRMLKKTDAITYVGYEFKGGKVYYKNGFSSKEYMKEHKADYKIEKIKK